jgi:hypothetical protein
MISRATPLLDPSNPNAAHWVAEVHVSVVICAPVVPTRLFTLTVAGDVQPPV